VRHRQRAAVPRLDLRREIEEDGARDLRAFRVHAVRTRQLHERVPRRMKLNLVVVQRRRIPPPGPRPRARAPRRAAGSARTGRVPRAAAAGWTRTSVGRWRWR
jgi:hypothetical protein